MRLASASSPAAAIAKVKGGKRVTGVAICAQAGEGAVLEEIPCEAVAMFRRLVAGRPSVTAIAAASSTWDDRHLGLRARSDPSAPEPRRLGHGRGRGQRGRHLDLPAISEAMSAQTGISTRVETEGRRKEDGKEDGSELRSNHPPRLGHAARRASITLRNKMWLDYQNDVKVSDVQLAAREGYLSRSNTPSVTPRLGMATDQGKLSEHQRPGRSWPMRLAQEIPQVGTTTFRPPYTPVTIGALAGESRGDIFQPLRRTPMHEAHEKSESLFRARRSLAPPLLLPEGG